MSLEEREIRHDLSSRRLRPAGAVWPEIFARLEERRAAPAARRFALATLAAVLVAAAVWIRHAPSSRPPETAGAFQVTRVETRGRPSAAVILQPDPDTLIVVVPD